MAMETEMPYVQNTPSLVFFITTSILLFLKGIIVFEMKSYGRPLFLLTFWAGYNMVFLCLAFY